MTSVPETWARRAGARFRSDKSNSPGARGVLSPLACPGEATTPRRAAGSRGVDWPRVLRRRTNTHLGERTVADAGRGHRARRAVTSCGGGSGSASGASYDRPSDDLFRGGDWPCVPLNGNRTAGRDSRVRRVPKTRLYPTLNPFSSPAAGSLPTRMPLLPVEQPADRPGPGVRGPGGVTSPRPRGPARRRRHGPAHAGGGAGPGCPAA
jgi:hypothetical protein